jgi:hypothetical protein
MGRAAADWGRSAIKSRPRTISTTFFAAPRNGTAFKPVSSAPRNHPLRRIVAATVASAMTVPIHGTLRAARVESRAPPQRTIRLAVVTSGMSTRFAIAVPGRYC